ncbi:MAG TPA: helix-turn-helix domain-containing protein [Candidatus Elarobacter sp.]|nr:helix-turn-helix domain-containing protein [Candidatus Elarobacter sp.]
MSDPKRGIKGRVYLSDEQVPAVRRQFGCARFVYNYLLDFSQKRYAADKTKPSKKQRSKELTRLKTELPWLREVNAQSLPTDRQGSG